MSVDALQNMYVPYLDTTGYSQLYSGNDFPTYSYGNTMPTIPFGGISSSYYSNPVCGAYQYNNGSYVDQIKEYQSQQLELSAPDEGIKRAATILNEKIIQSEQEQVGQAFDQLKAALRQKYPDASDEAITNRAHTVYEQMYGNTISQDLRANGSGSFWQGVKQILTLGLADKTTAEENAAKLNGTEVSRSEKAKKIAGNAVGGALAGAAIGAFAGPVGAGIGAIVGTVVGLIGGGIMTHCSKK